MAARRLIDLLHDWARWAFLRASGEPVPLPTVTIHLRSAREFVGIVRSVQDNHVLLDPLNGNRIYIPLDEIQAITDNGFGPKEPVETAPTLLQFRRNLADWEAELRSGFGVAIAVVSDMEPANLAALEALRSHCAEVTAGVARDREAYKAFARAVQTIKLGVADEPSLSLTGGVLNVVRCLPIVERMPKDQLRSAVESLL